MTNHPVWCSGWSGMEIWWSSRVHAAANLAAVPQFWLCSRVATELDCGQGWGAPLLGAYVDKMNV
eukprot:484416-Pelagomonas_calceolata.AAC.4